ncbi:hypothetical protein FQZ97_273680 [compost metagenome]
MSTSAAQSSGPLARSRPRCAPSTITSSSCALAARKCRGSMACASPYRACHWPSASWLKRRRRASWRSATAFSARASRSTSSVSVGCSSSAWFQCWRCGISLAKKRRWNGVRAISPWAGPRSSCTAAVLATAASSRRVCWRNRSRGPICRPAWRARLATWMAMMESPPSSKKLSSAPISAMPSTSLQMRARLSSTAPLGATWLRGAWAGCGSALRSSLPLAFSGMRSSTTICAGTMYSGRSAARAARRRAGSSASSCATT